MDKRICFTCKREKPLNGDYFPICKSKKYGFNYECKECKSSRDKNYRSSSEVHKSYIKSPSFVFRQLAYQAKKRKIKFELTYEYYLENLAKKPCYLCGETETKYWVDRIINDHEIGYTISNTAPCCEYCNKMKVALEKDFFINHCKKIVEFNRQ